MNHRPRVPKWSTTARGATLRTAINSKLSRAKKEGLGVWSANDEYDGL